MLDAGDEPATEAAVTGGPLQIRHVIIERRNGRDRVVAELNRPAAFRVLPGSEGPARLEISGAHIGAEAARHLEGDSASAIKSADLKESADRTVIEVNHTTGTNTTAIREGNRIVWLFAERRTCTRTAGHAHADRRQAGSRRGRWRASRGIPERRADADRRCARQETILGPAHRPRSQGRRHPQRAAPARGRRQRQHRHRRRRRAARSRSGCATCRGIRRSTSILKAKGLGMVRRGNLISRRAARRRSRRSARWRIARQKQQIELAPLETRLVPVSYAHADELSARVKELLSPRGSVAVDERTNMLIVRDVAGNLERRRGARALASTRRRRRCSIEARIVEATSRYTARRRHPVGRRRDRIELRDRQPDRPRVPARRRPSPAARPTARRRRAGLSPFAAQASRTRTSPSTCRRRSAPGKAARSASRSARSTATSTSAVRLSAAETTGHVRIISSPRILTLDNHEAHDLRRARSIPFSQVSAQGVQTTFQEAKLQLTVTPHVTSDGAVVDARRRSTATSPTSTRPRARGDPTILKREAETEPARAWTGTPR